MSEKSGKKGRFLRSRGIWPMALTVLFSLSSVMRLLQGDVIAFGLGVVMTVLLGAGTWSLRQGLDHQRGEGGFPGRTPGAILIGLATAGMSAMLAGHGWLEGIILGLAAGAGTVMAYGYDLPGQGLKRASKAPADPGLSSDAERLIAEAKAKRDRLVSARHKLQLGSSSTVMDQVGKVAALADEIIDAVGQDRKELRSARRAMAGHILGQRIDRVVALTDRIIERIRQDPRDLRRARKFMNVYLDGAAQVAERLVRLQQNDRAAAAEMAPRMVALLAAMERAAEELHQKLLANDTLDLDVQMEVLEQRIQREGLST